VGKWIDALVTLGLLGGTALALYYLFQKLGPPSQFTKEQWDIFWSMGDINRDGYIDDKDLELLRKAYDTNDPNCDLNKDGIVDTKDISIIGHNYGKNIWDFYGVKKI